ncbi:uncharacterized protein PRCAT00005968001 [Priceomyces carsonii]|uniref:uncharacterized protein n=1 Tax=Priceomyces carsonii TaxID=28549 RepID=UPI002EDAFBE2|nr:unnamed protein product [Priceomyces carsonii]
MEAHIPRSSSHISQLSPSLGSDDPILTDLMKLSPHKPSIVTKDDRRERPPESINEYSKKINVLLTQLKEKSKVLENQRISFEAALFDLTSYIPVSSIITKDSSALQTIYPNETLSKILVDNYSDLIELSSNYFNLSLASHVTKYTVELIYSLQYWEVYHLVYLIPNLKYFLKLLGFEIFQTPFGVLVKPPLTYVEESMLGGLQYPFPYPFYNYSYHSFDEDTVASKYSKIKVNPYIDITLKNVNRQRKVADEKSRAGARIGNFNNQSPLLTPPRAISRSKYSRYQDKHDEGDEEDEEEEGEEEEEEDDEEEEEDEEEEDYGEGEENDSRMLEENMMSSATNHGDMASSPTGASSKNDHKQELMFILLSPAAGNSKTSAPGGSSNSGMAGSNEKKNKSKSGVIHQCHLVDPNTLRSCLKIFYGKNELLRHQEFVHATKKKIYKCIYCSRNGSKIQSYPRHDSLARHIRRKHGITGKENKMAVNYAKENVEIIDDPSQININLRKRRSITEESIEQDKKMKVDNLDGESQSEYQEKQLENDKRQTDHDNKRQKTLQDPLPHPDFLNPDFTIKAPFADFLLFNSRERPEPRANYPNRTPSLRGNTLLDVLELPPIESNTGQAVSHQQKNLQKSPIERYSKEYQPEKFKDMSLKDNFQKFRISQPSRLPPHHTHLSQLDKNHRQTDQSFQKYPREENLQQEKIKIHDLPSPPQTQPQLQLNSLNQYSNIHKLPQVHLIQPPPPQFLHLFVSHNQQIRPSQTFETQHPSSTPGVPFTAMNPQQFYQFEAKPKNDKKSMELSYINSDSKRK